MDKEFWDREVKEKATLYVMNLKSRSELVDPGHGAKFPEANGGSLEEQQPPHKRTRRGQPHSKRMQSNGDGVSSASASARDGAGTTPPHRTSQKCWKWNEKEDGCQEPCPDGRAHKCLACGGDHRMCTRQECSSQKGKGKRRHK